MFLYTHIIFTMLICRPILANDKAKSNCTVHHLSNNNGTIYFFCLCVPSAFEQAVAWQINHDILYENGKLHGHLIEQCLLKPHLWPVCTISEKYAEKFSK